MKKVNLIWIIALILTIPNSLAYINCTTSACPPGYTDNGEVCPGSTCARNCTRTICGSTWTQIHSNTFGWDGNNNDEQYVSSTGYTPADAKYCYNFSYKGPPASEPEIRLFGSTNPSFDCDAEMIGGFRQGVGEANSWFNGMSRYIGDQTNTDIERIIKIVRASAEEDSDSTYRNNAAGEGFIYCGPTTSACSLLGGTSNCDTDCYNKSTVGRVGQGYYKDKGHPDTTLYDGAGCGGFVDANEYDSATFKVYETQAIIENNDQSCDRIHEAPLVSNVKVLPEIPNAGQDLLCNYTYSDPENFTEQNSSYEWWKNGANQNINSQTLAKSNLTPGDELYCKVTPSDGLLFGTQIQSSNTVIIRNATLNPILYVGMNAAWNHTSYFGIEENVIDFSQELVNVLATCVADSQGYCNISLTFSSSNVGVLNLSDIEIYYAGNASAINQTDIIPPSYSNLKTSPTSPATYQKNQQYQFNATWQDNSGIATALIEFNGINYTMSQNGNEYYRTFTDLAVGSYNYYFWANDTSGNYNKTDTFTYTINKATPTGSLTNNVSWSITYGKHVSIGFSETNEGDGDLIYKIYRNLTDIGSGGVITLAAGIYQYVLNTTGGQNYSSTSSIDAQTLTVSKAQSSTSLTFDKTSPQTYGTSITPTCSVAIGVGTPTLTMNGTSITSGNPLTLGAGTYQFNCSLAESQNYTSPQNISSFVINQAVPNLTYYLNGLTQNISVQYPQKINASAYATGGTVNIFRNASAVTSENSVNVTLAVSYYQYGFNVTGNQNYTDVSSKFLFANINKGASVVYTYVNNQRANTTITIGSSIYLNGTLIAGEGQIQLYNNGTLINSGQSPLSNLTAFNSVGLFNITTIYPETQNYTSSYETWWVNATETPPAGLTVTSLNAVYSNDTRYNFEFIIRNSGTSNLTNINWSLNTGLATISSQQPLNLTGNEDTTIFVDYTYPQTGEYNVVATATDGINQDSESTTINIPDLEVMELSVLNSSNRRRTFEFILKNYLSTSLSNVTWNVKFGDGNNLNNTDIILQPLENMSVYVDYTYATANTYVVNASAVNGTMKGYQNITITVT